MSWAQGIEPRESVIIGDSAKDDVACGRRAGAYTILLDSYGRHGGPGVGIPEDLLGTEAEPHFMAHTMEDVRRILEAEVRSTCDASRREWSGWRHVWYIPRRGSG